MKARCPTRRGYTLVLVVLFLVLFLGLWGQAARQIGSMIRIEEARAARVRRDAARLQGEAVLAQALAALETGFPTTSPYTCAMTAPNGSTFAATFVRDPVSTDEWVVSAEPTTDDSLPPFDSGFFVATPPSFTP